MAQSPLISTHDLAEAMSDPRLRIIDATWHLDGRDARKDHEQSRIPGAVFFDIDALSDHSSDLPHMLPDAATFAGAVGRMGISDTDRIVVYDGLGLFSAARVWWTLGLMGATDVQVLDGGLPKWAAEGRPTEAGQPASLVSSTFNARKRPYAVADIATILSAISGDAQIVDARPAVRFHSKSPEPRAGLRSGHMPGALNLPFKSLLQNDGTLRRGDDLAQVFGKATVNLNRPVITTCGSGITAAILTLALAELGHDSRLYDGSWAEWGAREDTPVVG